MSTKTLYTNVVLIFIIVTALQMHAEFGKIINNYLEPSPAVKYKKLSLFHEAISKWICLGTRAKTHLGSAS